MPDHELMVRYGGKDRPLNLIMTVALSEDFYAAHERDIWRIAGIPWRFDADPTDAETEDDMSRLWATPWSTDDGLAAAFLALYVQYHDASVVIQRSRSRPGIWDCEIQGLAVVWERDPHSPYRTRQPTDRREPFWQEGEGQTFAEAVCRAICHFSDDD